MRIEISIPVLALLTLLVTVAAAEETRPPAASAELQGALLLVRPNGSHLGTVVHVSGPAGYWARSARESAGPVALDLLLDGRLENRLEPAASSASGGDRRQPAIALPPGTYRWTAFVTNLEGQLFAAEGRFDLGAGEAEGVATPEPRDWIDAEIDRADDDPIQRRAEFAADFLRLFDDADDGVVSIRIESDDPNNNILEQWRIQNRFGDFRIDEYGNGSGLQGTALAIVDDGDREIGFGTTLPLQRLHMVGGESDGLRLEDAVGSGTGAWDLQVLGGDSFQIEDQLTGADPLVIEERAPDNALYVDSSGRLGLGTNEPSHGLHLVSSRAGVALEESDGLALAHLVAETLDGREMFEIRNGSSGSVALSIDLSTGAIGLSGTLTSSSSGAHLSAGGEWVSASSRALKENVEPLEASAAMAALDGLEPVAFNYKAEPDDRQVGFIAEDVPELVATADRKGLATLDVVGVLTRVVQEQQRELRELRSLIEGLTRSGQRGR